MNRKKTAAAFVITALGAAVIAWAGRGIYDKFVHMDIYSKLVGIENVLEDAFLYDYDEKKLADYAALGLSMALDDPYTVYYSRDQFTDYMNSGSGDFVGIGVTVVFDKENDEIDVISVQEDSPSMEAGILPGDVILAVDGERFSGSQMNDAVSKIRGIGQKESVENTSVVLTVRRSGAEQDITVTRRKMHQDTVKYEMMDENIGYIRITAFNRGSGSKEKSTSEDFSGALSDLTSKGMKKLIIDVRDNGGGDVDIVSAIIDEIVPEGLIMYTIDKHGKRDELRSDKNELNMPIAVLVNGNSASASELLTGALRDYDKAAVIGTKTFGKGVMQRVYPFSDGSGMTVTVAKYYTPNGTCVQDEGITPDIIAEPLPGKADIPISSLERADDIQLQRAVDYLKSN
ncbi:MAG: PDZ domain-containing protein [Clostridia bacterium]|nr:PDZ domain-containing protein [Clostridia bacterium]